MSARQQQGPGRNVNVMKHAEGGRVLSLALALLFPFVLAAAPGAAAAEEFVVGGGSSVAAGRDYTQFAFSAHNAADGTTSGHITLNWPPASSQLNSAHGQLLADVVCLVVDGNRATAYGVVTKSDNPDGPSDADWVGIAVADEPDTFYAFFGYGEPPCTFQAGGFPLFHGNIVVRN
jgi:predicted lipoprotein with Yx(FWY)xxD motif